MSSKKIALLAALLVAGTALGIISYGELGENLVYFWSPEELLSKGEKAQDATIRLGGVVREGSVEWDPETLNLQFVAAMQPKPGGPEVLVTAKGAPPQMFREGIGVVVEGRYDGEAFRADRVMVKHSNEYRAPEAGERPQDLYRTLIMDDS